MVGTSGRRRPLLGLAAIALLAAACSPTAVEDPGLGDAPLTTRVLAADGTLIAEWHRGVDRRPVDYEEVPGFVVDAVVAIEDHRYWDHGGVDLIAIGRALLANLDAGEVVEGGSTITQQYVKNVLLGPELDLSRKVEEASLAVALERNLSKEEILERYLNTIYLGNGAYGIGAAARRYFGVDVADLSLPQAALLAGMIRSPSTTDPLVDAAAARERRDLVLRRLGELGWVDEADVGAAIAEPLQLAPTERRDTYPHFSAEVRRFLLGLDALGDSPEAIADRLDEGGLTVETTLQPRAQIAAERALFDVTGPDGPDAALVAVDPSTGAVVALVGGRDFYSGQPGSQFNLATQGSRQPGSTMKPFVLAAALEAGADLTDPFSGASPITIQTGEGPWTVSNFDDDVFPTLTLLDATTYSVNTSYASLIDDIGAASVAELAERAGLRGLDPVPSLALGTEEVTLLDLTAAYTVFANAGNRVVPHPVRRVLDENGDVLWASETTFHAVVSADTAAEVTAALGQVVHRGTGQSARIGRPSAGKTGTTQGNSDAWFVGYTPELVAGVWIGFADGSRTLTPPSTPLTVSGGTWPAVAWSRFASAALSGVPYGEMPSAAEVATPVRIDRSNGAVLGECAAFAVIEIELIATFAEPVDCAGELTLPDFLGRPAGDAANEMGELDIRVEVRWRQAGEFPQGTVIGQTPPSGVPLLTDTVVILEIVGEPAPIPDLTGLTVAAARSALHTQPVIIDVIVTPGGSGVSGVIWQQSVVPTLPGHAPIVTVSVSP